MNTKHVPSLELCQEFDMLCKENNITLPETEYFLARHSGMDGTWSDWYLYSEKDNHSPDEQIPAPLVSEQGEWLGEVSGKDFLNSYLEVMDLFIFQIDKVQMSHNLMTDPDIGISMINYLIAEGIITKL